MICSCQKKEKFLAIIEDCGIIYSLKNVVMRGCQYEMSVLQLSGK